MIRRTRRATGYHHYRCEPIFDRVLLWLKAHGVIGRKPLRALRKEYGSLINDKYDLVHRLICSWHMVGFKMGRRQGARRAHI
jgi:hypothetical protein